ncbi:MAG: cell division protein SepF [Oscillospiraceae bacterium]|nr:cell division protein SepF [Oscillospiraceae bacterium]
MNLWKKFTSFGDDGDDNDVDYSYDDEMFDYPEQVEQVESGGGGSNFGGISAGTLELKVVRPEGFDAVAPIADHLLNNRTVVLNLEATNKETARRLIDFLSGVAYSIDGKIKRVANNTYVITPNNVDVSGDATRESQKPAQPQNRNVSEDIFGF